MRRGLWGSKMGRAAAHPAIRLLRSMAGNESGATAAVFAIVFSAILLASAVAIDFARSTAEQSREQQALDAATLAASDMLGLPDQDAIGKATAEAFFKANIGNRSNAVLEKIVLDKDAGEVRGTSQGTIVSSLMKVFGADTLRIGANSKVAKGDGTFEIALVLDNSGSMAGTYIADLKTAAKNLSGIMFVGAEGTDKVKIGVVPFASSVNVGAGNRTANWIDDEGASSVHYQNVSENRTRLQLFDDMGVAWGGCVEVRPGELATNDLAPISGNSDSYFVPMLAPDEPDGNNDGGDSYSNSYLVDDAGACTPQPTVCTKYDRKGKCTQSSKTPLTPQVAQARTCKYKNQAPSSGTGPNLGCTTKPVLPLTSQRASVDSHIDSLAASGNTNIGEGLMWGWRVLSPGEPFTGGREDATPKNTKIIILMTDGQNTYTTTSNHNKSTYGAFGYASKNRLGAVYTTSAIRTKMDDHLKTACTNAKATGIMIYTVAFRLEGDTNTQNLLKACASANDKYFAASSGSVLITTFQTIARQLTQLRVTG
jgi:Flp pilus assembly protein TadG